MAKTDIEEMVLRLSADYSKMQKKLDQAVGVGGRAASRIEGRFKTMNTTLSRHFEGLGVSLKAGLAGMVAGFSIDKIVSASIDAVKKIAEIGDVAESIGVTVEQLQAFQRLAIETGTNSETIRKGLQSIAEQSVDTGSALSKLFSANGLSLRDAAGKLRPMNDIIADFARLVQNAGTQADQLGIITGVLGDRVGRELVEAFRKGADGVARAYDSMLKSGEYHSATEVERIQKIEEAYNRVTDRIAIRWQQMVVKIADGIDAIGSQVAATQNQPEFLFSPRAGKIPNPNYKGGSRTSGMGSFGGPNEFAQPPLQAPQVTISPSSVEKPPRSGGDGRRASGSNALSRSDADAHVDAYSRVQDAIKSYVESLGEERKALELEIQTFGMSEGQKRRAEAIAQIPVNASKAQTAAAIEQANAIAALTEKYDALQKHQEQVAEISDTFRDGVKGLASDLASGTKPIDALTSALERLGSQLLDIGLNSIFGSGNGGIGGLLGGLFGGGGLYANGGIINHGVKAFATGGIVGGATYFPMAGGKTGLMGEKGPEAIVPLPDGRAIPVRVQGGSGSGSTVVHQTINIQGTGDAQLMANVRMAVERGNRELIARLPQINLERELRAG